MLVGTGIAFAYFTTTGGGTGTGSAGTNSALVPVITASGSLASASQTETVTPGAASQLAFTAQSATGASVTAGVTTAFGVSVEDQFGNVRTGDNATTVKVAIGANPGGSSLTCTSSGGAGPVAVVNGVASFRYPLNKIGTGYTITATSTPGLGTATSNSFNVVTVPPTISFPTSGSQEIVGHGQSVTFTVTGTAFQAGVTVTVSPGHFTVNNVVFVNSTTLNVNVTAINNNKGTDDLTVTNPDGGTVTTSGSMKNN